MHAFRKPHTLGLIALILIGAVVGLFRLYKWTHPSPSCLAEFDLIITGAEIIDGSGRPPFLADIGIKDKRITCIGDLAGAKSQRVIEAKGLSVAPGFIDVHTHVERNVPTGSPFLAPNFVHQGVTTIITGNCGRSFLDIAKFLKLLEANGSQVNVATLIGHNTVRQSVMKQSSLAPSPQQLQAMSALVDRGMADGAFGMSTGLVYVPGTFAKIDEIVALAKPVARRHGTYVSHIRDEAAKGEAAILEAIAVGQKTSAHVHISHFKAQGPNQWGSAQARLDLLRSAQNLGLTISLDQYPYNASSTGLAVLLPSWLSDGSLSAAQRKLSDPTTRAHVRREMLDQLRDNGWNDYSFARIAYCQFDRSLIGLNIAEVTEKRNAGSATSHHANAVNAAVRHSVAMKSETDVENKLLQQADTVIDLYTHGGAQMVFFDMAEDDIETVIKNPAVMFGSDSSVRGEDGSARPHPRGIGTFPRVIGLYARDKGLLSIEEAVRRMTSLPATTFGIGERGYIRINYWADLVIFDRNRIRDRATYEEPLNVPDGISYVIVNGSIVLDQNGPTTVNPGMVIRHDAQSEAQPATP